MLIMSATLKHMSVFVRPNMEASDVWVGIHCQVAVVQWPDKVGLLVKTGDLPGMASLHCIASDRCSHTECPDLSPC